MFNKYILITPFLPIHVSFKFMLAQYPGVHIYPSSPFSYSSMMKCERSDCEK